MDTLRRIFIEWYWGNVSDIFITLVVSVAIGAFLQAIKYGIGYFIMTPEQAEIIVYKVFNIFSIPSVISSAISICTMLAKLVQQLIIEIRNTFFN